MLDLLCKIQLMMSHFVLLLPDIDKIYISTKCEDLGNSQNAGMEFWNMQKVLILNYQQ